MELDRTELILLDKKKYLPQSCAMLTKRCIIARVRYCYVIVGAARDKVFPGHTGANLLLIMDSECESMGVGWSRW